MHFIITYDNILNMKIAFVGPPAVGKDAVSDYIAQKFSLRHISSGNIVRNYTKENNLGSFDRDNLRVVANKMRTEFGGDILVQIALQECPDDLVLSGLRSIDEVTTFKKNGGRIICITAPLAKRYELAKIRGRIGDNVSFEEFRLSEEKEYLNPDKNTQNVKQDIEMADTVIVNDSGLEELFNKTYKIIADIKAGDK